MSTYRIGSVQVNRELASWLIVNRAKIERDMAERLGPAAPVAAAPESEALRRFRSFASASLIRGKAPPPPLDGLRINERRVMALLEAWLEAALRVSEFDQRERTRDTLQPLLDHFRLAIRSSGNGRRTRGAPRAKRRAVVAAIDRVADAFLAVDADTGKIEDANPAAGALLGIDRDALLGVDALAFVPKCDHSAWWSRLDAIAEGSETQHFDGSLLDTGGIQVGFAASATRFSTRGRTLALILMRPRVADPSPAPRY
jgi:PAS domain-containing protein